MSEFSRCKMQIKSIGVSILLFAIVMCIFVSISSEEMNKIVTGVQIVTVPDPKDSTKSITQVMPAELADDTKNKLMAASVLGSAAAVIFVLSLFIATGKGCYKTSLYGILFGSLFGIL